MAKNTLSPEKTIRVLNLIIGISIAIHSFYYTPSYTAFGIYFIFNGLGSLIFFFMDKKSMWLQLGSLRYLMEKILGEYYQKYMNISAAIISFFLAYFFLFRI